MLVARRTITLSLALLVLLSLTSPNPTLAAIKRVGSGRRLKQKKQASAAPADGHRRDQEEAVTYIEPNGDEEVYADSEYGYGGSGKGKHLYTIGGKGGSCGGPFQMCCSDPAARCVPGYGCDYAPTIQDPDEDEGVNYPPYTCTPCGGDSQPCCKTSCSTEDCESECTRGNTCNLFSNKCETCGTSAGEPCCEGNLCPGSGLSCDTSTMMCMECGDVDEICCQGDICNYNATGDVFCNTDVTPKKCEFCGDIDQLCCPGDVCSSSDHVCNTVTGHCEDCGGLNEACCAGEKCPGSTPDQILFCNSDANQCEVCGEDGQQCCPGDVCADGTLACNTATGKCASCGGVAGNVCCSGSLCPPDDPSTQLLFCNDASNECEDCGGTGQKCCPGDECSDGNGCNTITDTCEACGGNGKICCPGNRCNQGGANAPLVCNKSPKPFVCERCGGPGELCCDTKDSEFECDGGNTECLNGRCPDLGTDPPMNCQLTNGKAAARAFNDEVGCAISNNANPEQAQMENDALCCKDGAGCNGGSEGGIRWCTG